MIGSVPDLAIIVILGLVLFGAKNIPELGKNLGRGLREFKSGMNDLKNEVESSLEDRAVRVEAVTSKASASVTAPKIEASSSATPNASSPEQ